MYLYLKNRLNPNSGPGIVLGAALHYLSMNADELSWVPFSPWGQYHIPQLGAILFSTYYN